MPSDQDYSSSQADFNEFNDCDSALSEDTPVPLPAAAGKKNVCSHCGACLSSVWSLDRHVNQIHLKVKNYVCDKCGKAFFHRYKYTYHMNWHEKEEAEMYRTCDLCGDSYKFKHKCLVVKKESKEKEPKPKTRYARKKLLQQIKEEEKSPVRPKTFSELDSDEEANLVPIKRGYDKFYYYPRKGILKEEVKEMWKQRKEKIKRQLLGLDIVQCKTEEEAEVQVDVEVEMKEVVCEKEETPEIEVKWEMSENQEMELEVRSPITLGIRTNPATQAFSDSVYVFDLPD